jgi:hypothetical protein
LKRIEFYSTEKTVKYSLLATDVETPPPPSYGQ